jgi:hypothetical protein
MFAHLKKYHNAEIVFDPSEPVITPTLSFKIGDQVSLAMFRGEKRFPPTCLNQEN